jgi:hypothetical protein
LVQHSEVYNKKYGQRKERQFRNYIQPWKKERKQKKDNAAAKPCKKAVGKKKICIK